MTTINTNSGNSYDEVQYESYPYSQTHPAQLKTIATIFGLKAPKIETAKILELGCAAGGNIIPMAKQFPKAQIVGVDLSKNQIEDGQQQIKDLNLSNIELKHMSISDIDKSLGKFDYIICHGILSWVPKNVQDDIFRVCSENLSKNGVSYISYNTLPGWNAVRTVRDMMKYHTEGFNTAQEKVSQARSILNFIKEATEHNESPHAKIIKTEAAMLANQPDPYLLHDHLEDQNEQFYFSDFMNSATKKGLQYLGDTNLVTMYLGNLPQKAAEKLSEVKDIVRTEQYMDYIYNRRFRTTLLCHKDAKLNRNIKNEDISKFSLKMNVAPLFDELKTDLDNTEVVKFALNNNKETTISTSNNEMKAIFLALSKTSKFLSVDELVKAAHEVNSKLSEKAIKAELINNAMRFVLSGHIQITTDPLQFNTDISDKPKLYDLASYQMKRNQNWVTTQNHSMFRTGPYEKLLLQLLDGNNSQEQIISKMIEAVKNGELNMQIDNKPVTDEKIIKENITKITNNFLNNIANSGLLVA